MSVFDPDTQLHISIQKALLQEVGPDLVGVTCGLKGSKIRVIAYYDHAISPRQWEHVRSIGAEVISDFPAGFDIVEEARDASEGLTPLDFWALLRADLSEYPISL
jgi:hypothetical protein